MTQIIYFSTSGIERLLSENGYTITDEPNKLALIITKDEEHIVTVHYETTRQHLSITSYTYRLYYNRMIKLNNKTAKEDGEVINNLMYSGGLRLAIKNTPKLRILVNKAQNQLFKQSN